MLYFIVECYYLFSWKVFFYGNIGLCDKERIRFVKGICILKLLYKCFVMVLILLFLRVKFLYLFCLFIFEFFDNGEDWVWMRGMRWG